MALKDQKLELFQRYIEIPTKLFCMVEFGSKCYIVESKLNVIINLN